MPDEELDGYLLRVFTARQREVLDGDDFMERVESEIALGRNRGARHAAASRIARAAWAGIGKSLLVPRWMPALGWAGAGAFLVFALFLLRP